MKYKYKKLIILGSGPAGYCASLYAARANLSPTLITGMEVGGQLMTTTIVDNWLGDVDGVLGPDLMMRMKSHSERFGTEFINDSIHKIDINKSPFTLFGNDDNTYCCQALIIATGSNALYLGLDSEKKYLGRGVSACATCDGFFFKSQTVAVIGGGNTAIEEALYLSNIAKEVILVHRRDTFKGEEILVDKLLKKAKDGNIKLELNYTVKEILGDKKGVCGIEIINKQGISKKISLQGVFVAIGHKPNTDIFKDKLKMKNSYLVTNFANSEYATQTNISGIFAAGDVADSVYRQAITSAGTGCMAALDAKNYLQNNKL